MVQEILTFGNIEIEKYKTYPYKSPIYLDVNSVLVSKKIFLVKNTINTLLVTCMMIVKLSHYI